MTVKRGDLAVIDDTISWWPADGKFRLCIVLGRVNVTVDTLFAPGKQWGEIMLGPGAKNTRYVLWQDGTVGLCSEQLLRVY